MYTLCTLYTVQMDIRAQMFHELSGGPSPWTLFSIKPYTVVTTRSRRGDSVVVAGMTAILKRYNGQHGTLMENPGDKTVKVDISGILVDMPTKDMRAPAPFPYRRASLQILIRNIGATEAHTYITRCCACLNIPTDQSTDTLFVQFTEQLKFSWRMPLNPWNRFDPVTKVQSSLSKWMS